MDLGARQAASGITRLFAYMGVQDVPQTPIIVSVSTLQKNPGVDELKTVIFERAKTMSRFRSKLVAFRKGGVYFEEVPLDEGYHFHVHQSTNEVCTIDELNALVSANETRFMDLEKPLWKVIFIPTFEDSTSKLLVVISHAIGDGIGLVKVLLFRLIDESEELAKVNDDAYKLRKRKRPKLPFSVRARVFMRGIWEGNTAAFWSQDKPNPLKLIGTAGTEKASAAATNKIPLSQIKQVCRAIGHEVTVNDVLMAVFTKTVGYYCRDIAKEPIQTIKHRTIRANFPIDMRRGNQAFNKHGDVGNLFALGLFYMPMKYFDQTNQLILEVKRRIDHIKVSPQPLVAVKAADRYLAIFKPDMVARVVGNAANLATCMLSNVPGPQHTVHIAGSPVTDFSFYLFGLIGVYFGIFSYNGEVSATVNVDTKIGVDPKLLANLFVPCFDEIFEDLCPNLLSTEPKMEHD